MRGPRKEEVDYSLYLVTDSGLISTSAQSFENHVSLLVEGGVSIVQLREKTMSTANFVERGRQLLDITRRRKIPLIINDRLDVALAIDADGIHIGQDDMGIAYCFTLIKEVNIARRLIGNDKILGVSVNTLEEVQNAISGGADYLGALLSVFRLTHVQESGRYLILQRRSSPLLPVASKD
jgi:thiamine-phosphate diphosphorylase / hydroxyethylthiazole kinase